jgi:hypothetical protein
MDTTRAIGIQDLGETVHSKFVLYIAPTVDEDLKFSRLGENLPAPEKKATVLASQYHQLIVKYCLPTCYPQ